ncbi:MAG: tetratricopeptide repeat protein, partial [Bacteroidota bacterium]
ANDSFINGSYSEVIALLAPLERVYSKERRTNEMHYLLGFSYQMQGDQARAISHYKSVQANTSDTYFRKANQQYARLLDKNGDTDKAIETLEMLTSYNLGNQALKRTLEDLANLYLKAENYDQALDVVGRLRDNLMLDDDFENRVTTEIEEQKKKVSRN